VDDDTEEAAGKSTDADEKLEEDETAPSTENTPAAIPATHNSSVNQQAIAWTRQQDEASSVWDLLHADEQATFKTERARARLKGQKAIGPEKSEGSGYYRHGLCIVPPVFL
jgi:hypothetical protein